MKTEIEVWERITELTVSIVDLLVKITKGTATEEEKNAHVILIQMRKNLEWVID